MSVLESYLEKVREVDPLRFCGYVDRITGLVVEAVSPPARIGDFCTIITSEADITAEVVGFRGDRLLLMPLGEVRGIKPGDEVVLGREELYVDVGMGLLGRVLDGLGRPIDEKGPLTGTTKYPVFNRAPNPLKRRRIKDCFPTGIKAVDGLITCGKGQRMGIFSGSGVGKSTFLGMIARHGLGEVNVIALIGERGREVKEFIERDLGRSGMERSILVVATSDEPALVRINAAFVASAIAEYFRSLGKDVVLLLDSITRLAMAQREVGLAVGEPPTTRGYTPSVFALLPKLLERAGTDEVGSITAFYTVLVESDDMNDPIADAVRSILDGHIVLSRDLASRGHYPAVDVLYSVSRLMMEVTTPEHQRLAQRMREILAVYRSAEDLINIGAYKRGSSPKIDQAIDMIDRINEFLRQAVDERVEFSQTLSLMQELVGNL